MKSRIQHEDGDDIRTSLIKRGTVTLTVESERYIPPDSVRLQSSVPSSVHLGTSCKMHHSPHPISQVLMETVARRIWRR